MTNRTRTIAVMFSIVAPLMFMAVNVAAADTGSTVINNSVFSPFFTQPVSFDVYDGETFSDANPTASFLGSIDTAFGSGQISTVFKKDGYQYPRIEVITSDPFLVDSTGQQIIENEASALVDPNDEIQIVTEGDKIIYLRKFYFAVDVGVRTRSNLPSTPTYYSYYISPLDNIDKTWEGRRDYDTFDKGGSSDKQYEVHEDYWYSLINAGTYDINTRDGWEGYYTEDGNFVHTALTQDVWDIPENKYAYIPVGWKEQDSEPIGVIGAVVNAEGNPWVTSWINEATRARITNSLVPMGSYLNPSFYNDPSDVNYLATISTHLKNNFGNRLVKVIPTIGIDIGGTFTYDYTSTNADGTGIILRSTSAKLGYYNVQRTNNNIRYGVVENLYTDTSDMQLQASIDANNDKILQHGTTFDQAGVPIPMTSVDPTGTIKASGSVYWLRNSVIEENLTAVAEADRTVRFELSDYDGPTDPLYYRDININEFDLPQRLTCQLEYNMQPVTTAYYANYRLNAFGIVYDWAAPGTGSTSHSVQRDINYPFRVQVENTYAVSRVVFSVAALSEIEGYIVASDGAPIKIEDWSDFEINTIGSILDVDDFLANYEMENQNAWRAWVNAINEWLSNPVGVITTIIVIIAVIFLIWFFGDRILLARSIGGRGTQQQKKGESFWITNARGFWDWMKVRTTRSKR